MKERSYLEFLAVAEGDVAEVDNPEVEVESTVEDEPEVIDEPSISEYDIDGEKVTLDQIKEWKNGHMRQSDYTKKTQEISKLRKENEEALELFNYLTKKPDLVKKLVELDTDNPIEANKAKDMLDPTRRELQEIKSQMYLKEIENELKDITSKDKDVTDLELLNLANEMKCTVSVAYDIWKGRNSDKILKRQEAELKRKLAEEVKTNAGKTKTLITTGDKTEAEGNLNLTDMQIAMAKRLGMSPEEYVKYQTNDNVW